MPRCSFHPFFFFFFFFFIFIFFTWDSFVIFMQVVQEVFMAEEWIRDARNEARAEASSRTEVEKSLGALKQKKQELATKLTVEEKARNNAEAGLKNIQDQTEDQRKKLYFTEIELATQKQLVLDLKANLEKAKAAT